MSRPVCHGIQMQNLIWAATGLTPRETLALLAIASFMNKRTDAWPGYTTLARMSRFRRRENAMRTVKGLVQKGILTITEGRKANTYTINPTPLWALIPANQHEGLARHGLYPPTGAAAGDSSGRPNRAASGASRCYLRRQQGATSTGSGVLPPETAERTRERTLERPKDVPCDREPPSEVKTRVRHSPPLAKSRYGPPLDGSQPQDFIENPTIRELWITATCHLNNPVGDGNPFLATAAGDSFEKYKTTTSLESLAIRLYQKKGRYPTPVEIAAAVNSRDFRGVKSLSWGWLCSRFRERDEVTGQLITRDRSARLEEAIIRQMELSDATESYSGSGRSPTTIGHLCDLFDGDLETVPPAFVSIQDYLED